MTVQMDLGQADVHIDGTPRSPHMKKSNSYTYECDGKSYECDGDEDSVDMIDAETRKSLPGDKFALPEERKYPIDTAARVRNAAARLEQQKSSMSSEKYSEAKSRIAAAAKKFGIDSEYNKKRDMADEQHSEPDGDEGTGKKGDNDGDETPVGKPVNASEMNGQVFYGDCIPLVAEIP